MNYRQFAKYGKLSLTNDFCYMVYYPWRQTHRQTDTQIGIYTLLYKVNNRVTTCRLSRCSSALEEWQTTSASHYPQHILWKGWISSYSIHNFINTLHLTLALHRQWNWRRGWVSCNFKFTGNKVLHWKLMIFPQLQLPMTFTVEYSGTDLNFPRTLSAMMAPSRGVA